MNPRRCVARTPRGSARPAVVAVVALLCALGIALTDADVARSETASAPVRGQASGEDTSPAFDLYLGPGFLLYTLGGITEAASPGLDLYLGPHFAPFASGGFASASSSTFDAWLGLFHEGRATSNPADIDTREGDPSFVAAPTLLVAAPFGCTAGIHLNWVDNSADETGFIIERKPAGFSPVFYNAVASLAANTTFTYDVPPFGAEWTYRVRAVRGQASSAYSSEATCAGGVATGAIALSGGVTIKSIGDRQGLRVHVRPPLGTDTWAGVKAVTVIMGDREDFTAPLDIQTLTTLPVSGEVVLDRFQGSPALGRWFRVLFRNECDIEIPAVAGTIGPYLAKQAPIVFVHGIWGSADNWRSWEDYFQSPDHGRLRTAAIPFRCDGDSWETWAATNDKGQSPYEILPQFIEDKLAGEWSAFESVDIVAHSQGGLAARYYIERTSFPKRVRRLVMLGTPNHGGNFAWLKSQIGPMVPDECANTGHGDGASSLRHDSPRLAFLNYGVEDLAKQERTCDNAGLPDEHVLSKRGDTRYYLVAGTASDGRCAWGNPLFCIVRNARTQDACSGDGIVDWESVRLRSLLDEQPARQWLDTDLAFRGVSALSHDDKTQANNFVLTRMASKAYLESTELRAFVEFLLAGDDTGLPSSSMGTGAQPALGGSAAARADDSPLAVLVATHDDTLTASPREHAVRIDGCSDFVAMVEWREGAGRVRLRAPDSTVYAMEDTLATRWLHYEANDTLAYAAFQVTNPPAGTWALIVDEPVTTPTRYAETWVSEGSPFTLRLDPPAIRVTNQQAGVLTARLSEGETAVAAQFEAWLHAPDGSTAPIALHDDGLDGDSLAADHVYSGTAASATQDGAYRVTCSARAWPTSESSPERYGEVVFDVAARPSLRLATADLSAAPPQSSVGQLTELRATLRNSGTVAADSAFVVFQRELTGDTLAALTVFVPAADSAQVTALWTPNEPGTHAIRVTASLTRQSEADPSDDVATFALPVVDVSRTLDVPPVAPAPVPTVFELAPPRPNPFRHVLALDFTVPHAQHVSLAVYDLQGRRVRRIADEWVAPGRYTRTWDARDQNGSAVRGGVFFIRLEGADRKVTRRAILIP